MRFFVLAHVMQTPSRTQLFSGRVLIDVVDGVIASVSAYEGDSFESPDGSPVHTIPSDFVLLPGLVDCHLHAPQWPQLGTAMDVGLEQWLFEHTFPLEASFADADFAQTVWNDMVPTLLAHGTTTAVYYGSVHEEATLSLAQTCATLGQRAFVGRVAVDHPEGTPDFYRDHDAPSAVEASRRSVHDIRGLGSSLVDAIITPRFAPACTDEAMRGLAAIAVEEDVLTQTHCSENDWEHGYALERYGCSDTEALDQLGLLRPHTILAHAGLTSEQDWRTISARGAAIAHCPLSNAYFGDAVLPTRRALDAGVTVGLGTDIAGGSEAGLLRQCHYAVTSSRMLEDGVDANVSRDQRRIEDQRITTIEAFYLATVGGAASTGLPVGLLEPGRRFDAFAVQLDRPMSPLRRWNAIDDDIRLFEKIVRLAGPDDIRCVWVDGKVRSGRLGDLSSPVVN